MYKLFNSVWSFIKKAGTRVMILILKFLTLITVGVYKSYKGIRTAVKWVANKIIDFSQSNIKGLWIFILLAVFFILASIGLYKGYSYAMNTNKNMDYMKIIIQRQGDEIERLRQENEQLKQDIIKKDAELQARAEEQARFAHQQWILANRYNASKRLSDDTKQLIKKYADIYGVKDTRMIECIIVHESGGRPDAVGDSGNAIGVAQYHLSTFLGHRKQMGLSEEDLRKDPEASIQAMLFSISHGGIGNWTARISCI